MPAENHPWELEKKKLGDSMTVSGAAYLAHFFKNYGITHVFFVDAIVRKALVEIEPLGIKRVLAHSEKAAAYMADGYARIARKPGICMSQSVGAANLAAGLQDAFLGNSPVIAITGRKDPIFQYRNAYQEIFHHRMFEPVTKFNARLESVEQLPFLLRQAFREATTGKNRPVHIDILGHLGQSTEKAQFPSEIIVESGYTSCPAHRPEPDMNKVKAAASLLKDSQKPVIVAGGGVKASGAQKELTRLAEKLLAPVATSANGKGAILDTHPLSVGVVGSYSKESANQVVSKADLVLFVGSGTGDMVTHNWTLPSYHIPIIQIDIDPSELGRNYPNAVGIHGDARTTLSRLIESLELPNRDRLWADSAKSVVRQWSDRVASSKLSGAIPIRPERLCQEISNALPENAVVVADTGYSTIWTSVMVDLGHPDQSYIRAAGSLGWAFPASLGAKCAAPDRPVICFSGDGGFWYHLSDLETAARCKINTITIINNNSCFSQCEVGVQQAYGDKAGQKNELYMHNPTNFAKIAEDMGCTGIRIENPDLLKGALNDALSSDAPVLIDVVTDKNSKPPWSPEYYK